MTNTTTTSRSGGLGVPSVLLIVFLVLKLTGVIAWSWLWVLAPLWIPVAVALLAFGPVLLVAAVADKADRS